MPVKNGAGEFKGPDTANVTAAIDAATINPDGTLTLNYTSANPGVYPISTISYFLIPTKMDANKGDNLIAFLNYALGDGQGKAAALGYAPLPDKRAQGGAGGCGQDQRHRRPGGCSGAAAPAPAPAPARRPTTAPKPAPKPAAGGRRSEARRRRRRAAPDPAIASTGAASASEPPWPG